MRMRCGRRTRRLVILGVIGATSIVGSATARAAEPGGVQRHGQPVEVDLGAVRAAATGAQGEFHPLTPSRILDTRFGTGRGGDTSPVGPDEAITVEVAGQGGVPETGVMAVVMNVTVADPTASSHVTAWPTGQGRPVVSNLNFVPGQTAPNLVVVAVGAGGNVNLYNAFGNVHLIVDVAGYYASADGTAGSRYHGVTPGRIVDTRVGTGTPGASTAPLGEGGVLHVDVTGSAGVPDEGVTAVAVNVTVTAPTSAGHLTVFPGDVSAPLASNLNFVPGLTRANLVMVRVPASGIVDFRNSAGDTHLVVDVVGYYDGVKVDDAGRLVADNPVRLFDTRSDEDLEGPCHDDEAVVLRSTESGVSAIAANVTVTEPTGAGHITASPGPPPVPLASTVNFTAGATVPNLAVVKVPVSGEVWFACHIDQNGQTHLLADLFALFT
jgi:hypothetical protein